MTHATPAGAVAIDEILRPAIAIPVLSLAREADSAPLARAFVAGGLGTLEITLRTDAALGAVRAIREAVPEAVVGVGTVTRPEELAIARDAGAQFAVSPGLDPVLAEAARAGPLPYLPAVATASEIMVAGRLGYATLKFFPAEASGGRAALASFRGPFAEVRFCPTGGIGDHNIGDYLAEPNVLSVGGAWLAPDDEVARRDWDAITRRARRVAETYGPALRR